MTSKVDSGHFSCLIAELESRWRTRSQPWRSGCWPASSSSSLHWLSMRSFSERKSSAKETKEKLWATQAQHSLSWRRKICQTQRAFKASITRFKSRRKLCRSVDEILIKMIILYNIFFQMTHCKSTLSLPTSTVSKFNLPVHNSAENINPSHSPIQPETTPQEHRINWDKHSTVIFPFLAITFNCFYWVYYLYLNKK